VRISTGKSGSVTNRKQKGASVKNRGNFSHSRFDFCAQDQKIVLRVLRFDLPVLLWRRKTSVRHMATDKLDRTSMKSRVNAGTATVLKLAQRVQATRK
jgi:hypothetical protein